MSQKTQTDLLILPMVASNFVYDEFIEKDHVYESVLSPGPYDEIVLSMLQHTLLTLLQLFKRVCADYLPGGKFHAVKDDEDMRQIARAYFRIL